MASLLKSTLNTRVLPAGEGRFYRSDAPVNVTREEIKWLRDMDIRTLVDLRSAEEAQRKPCLLGQEKDFTYVHLPVTGGGDTPISREHLYEVYRGMLDEQMERIVRTILQAKTKVMFFCTAGKDRTGVVAAVVLKQLGADDAIIIDDYMQSKDNLMGMLTAYAKEHPEVRLDIIIPQEENMARVLACLRCS